MPTIKQKKAVDKIMENNGNVSKSMREVGYSYNTAKTPKSLTTSKGYEELMEEHLPDNMLLGALEDDIKGKRLNRKAELELAFKLKGKMVDKQEFSGDLSVVIPSAVAKAFNINATNKETNRGNKEQE